MPALRTEGEALGTDVEILTFPSAAGRPGSPTDSRTPHTSLSAAQRAIGVSGLGVRAGKPRAAGTGRTQEGRALSHSDPLAVHAVSPGNRTAGLRLTAGVRPSLGPSATSRPPLPPEPAPPPPPGRPHRADGRPAAQPGPGPRRFPPQPPHLRHRRASCELPSARMPQRPPFVFIPGEAGPAPAPPRPLAPSGRRAVGGGFMRVGPGELVPHSGRLEGKGRAGGDAGVGGAGASGRG